MSHSASSISPSSATTILDGDLSTHTPHPNPSRSSLPSIHVHHQIRHSNDDVSTRTTTTTTTNTYNDHSYNTNTNTILMGNTKSIIPVVILVLILVYSTMVTLCPNFIRKVRRNVYSFVTTWKEFQNNNYNDDIDITTYDSNNDNTRSSTQSIIISDDEHENRSSIMSMMHTIKFYIQNQSQNMVYRVILLYEWVWNILYYVMDCILDWSSLLVGVVGISQGVDPYVDNNNNNIANNNLNPNMSSKMRRRRDFLINRNSMPMLEEVDNGQDDDLNHNDNNNFVIQPSLPNSKNIKDKSDDDNDANIMLSSNVEYNTNIEPAFLNEEDYPPGWLVYDPIRGDVVTRESLTNNNK